jgi:S1-C subfamily serine protease
MKKKGLAILSLLFCFTLSACSFQPVQNTHQLPTLQGSVSDDSSIIGNEDAISTQDAYVDLYERINPGVVSINLYYSGEPVVGYGYEGQGSGFVIDKEGYILTNYHVVENALQIEVVFSSGYRAKGEVIGTDLDSDIAVIKVDVPDEEIHPLILGSSEDVKVGQTVFAIGNPYGLSGTMTVGIVSARGRMLESLRESTSGGYFSSADLIQTDAAINPGNSGGPLLNLNGEVIGINRAIRIDGEDGVSTLYNSGVGFAVPVDVVKRVTPYLIEFGKYDYPYLGIVSREELGLVEREYLGLSADVQGAYVLSVVEGEPAEKAGIIGGVDSDTVNAFPLGGDLITAVDDQPVRNFSDLLSYLIAYKSPGDTIQVSLLRDGQELVLPVVLSKRPD